FRYFLRTGIRKNEEAQRHDISEHIQRFIHLRNNVFTGFTNAINQQRAAKGSKKLKNASTGYACDQAGQRKMICIPWKKRISSVLKKPSTKHTIPQRSTGEFAVIAPCLMMRKTRKAVIIPSITR